MNPKNRSKGKVFLVGAGPGDPDLLTRKAERVIKDADMVLYDKLVDERVIALVPQKAELMDVGKDQAHHKVPQFKINELLVKYARSGKTVVRLKGGDPYVFGRGGEEAEELIAHGVEVEVVPGISSAVAVPAYAGIPVTHRNYASTLTIITGHEAAGNELQWDVLARLDGTLVILMGVSTLAENVSNLIAFGKSARTPAAIIAHGTTRDQTVVVGTLDDIARKAEAADVTAPAVLIVGDVVKLRDTLEPRNANAGNH
ncbi:MAG: uroporphyrinogen-III C-methyltransferase [Euryarchaeota archaeon]